MRRLLAGAACVTAVGLVVAACGSGTGGGGGGYGSATNKGAAGATASTPAHKPSAGAAGEQVTMANIAFSPTQTTARVGQTVKWTNQDGVPHNVTAVKGATFKSKDLQPGQTYSYKAVRPGKIQYMCTIHPQMVATIQVVR
jgi:plastocyanin